MQANPSQSGLIDNKIKNPATAIPMGINATPIHRYTDFVNELVIKYFT